MTRLLEHLSLGLMIGLSFGGCASGPPAPRTVSSVDLERFMGDWYVLAHLPTRPERNAHAAMESYRLRDDGRIDIRFTFREGSLEGQFEELTMLGTVHDTSSRAEWRVRPFWPLSLDYLILHVDEGYQTTIIGHPSRDYAWIMARSPTLSEAEYDALVDRLRENGFPVASLRRIPQPAPSPSP